MRSDAAVANPTAPFVKSFRPWKIGSVPSMITFPSIAAVQTERFAIGAVIVDRLPQDGSPMRIARYEANCAVVIAAHSVALLMS